jgi:hypothetical protein
MFLQEFYHNVVIPDKGKHNRAKCKFIDDMSDLQCRVHRRSKLPKKVSDKKRKQMMGVLNIMSAFKVIHANIFVHK